MTDFFHTRLQGVQAEAAVARYLEHRGFVILERNYTQRYGEIDIIAQCNDLIIFVEVKMRTDPEVDPSELVHTGKQQKLIHTAKQYITTHYNDTCSYRFDVACVMGNHPSASILYLPDAFGEQ